MNLGDKILATVRYMYLLVFFLLVSGIFSAVLLGSNFELAMVGTLILFAGLLGSLLVWRSIKRPDEKKYLIMGFVILFLCLLAITAISHESLI